MIGSEFHVNFTGAGQSVGVARGALRVELLDLGWNKVFSRRSHDNEMEMVSLNGTVKATPTR